MLPIKAFAVGRFYQILTTRKGFRTFYREKLYSLVILL